MARTIAVGIDVGTYQVKVVVAEHVRGSDRTFPKVLGTGFAASRGLRHGYIINASDTVRSIKKAVLQAERSAQMKIKKAFLSIGGIGLEDYSVKSEVAIGRGDSEVTDLDIENALSACEEKIAQKMQNRRIVHAIPLRYKIDGSEVLGRPQGMKGAKLEVEMLFIICLEQHLDDLIAAVEDAGVEVTDVKASPIAGSLVTLTKAQKIAGCVLVNIGAETVSLVVFENNIPLSLKVFPVGSTDITNDIALGLKVSLEEAEELKRGSILNPPYPKKKLDDIIFARLGDILDLVEAHLKKIGKNGLLPAGIVLSGGGSGTTTLEDLARAMLKLPSKTAALSIAELPRENIKDSTWAVAYGLCIWGLSSPSESFGMGHAKKIGGSIASWFSQFLP